MIEGQISILKRLHSCLGSLHMLFGGVKLPRGPLLVGRLAFAPGAAKGGRHAGPGVDPPSQPPRQPEQNSGELSAQRRKRLIRVKQAIESGWKRRFSVPCKCGNDLCHGKKDVMGKVSALLRNKEMYERVAITLTLAGISLRLFNTLTVSSLRLTLSLNLLGPDSSSDHKDQAVCSISLSRLPPSTSPSVCPRPPGLPLLFPPSVFSALLPSLHPRLTQL